MTRERLGPLRLMVITDGARPPHIRAALRGATPSRRGSVAVQLRAPSIAGASLAQRARALAEICEEAGAPLIINDRADVAHAVRAGLHLPERGLTPEDARALVGPDALLGASRHEAGEAATWRGLDYVLLAPLAAVPGKGPPLGLQGLERALALCPSPLYALGGIEPELARRAVRAGARGVAVRSRVRDSPEPARAVRALLDATDG